MFNLDIKTMTEQSQSLTVDDQDSFFYSKMCTNITATNLESFNLENINKNDSPYQQSQSRDILFSKKIQTAKEVQGDEDVLQNSMFEKLNELSQKSSRVMSLFPGIGSRMLKGNSLIKLYPQSNFVVGEDQISNKLKIIRNLEDKITQLQQNISNPNVGLDYIGSIQKEINLNFQNYYQQVKENSNNKKQEQPEPNQSNGEQEVSEDEKSKMFPLSFSKKIQSPIQIFVCVPRIIEVEVPVTVMKPKEVYAQDGQLSSEWRKRLDSQKLKLNKNSRSKSENGDKKNSSGSSIQNIINEFTKKFNYQFNEKELFALNKNEQQVTMNFPENNSPKELSPISQQIDQKLQFNLPLDSFEKRYENVSQERQYAARRTDRSNMSSYSELQKIRDQFWNKDCVEFNQEYMNQVKEAQPKSNEQSFFENHKDLELDSRQHCRQNRQNQKEVMALTEQLVILKQQLSRKSMDLGQIQLVKRHLQALQQQKEEQLFEMNERYSNLLLESENLKQKLNEKQQQLVKHESIQKHLQDRIKELQKYISNQFEERDCEIQEMMQLIKQKNDEIQESNKIYLQLKQLLSNKDKEYQTHIIKHETQIGELKEEIQFYKRKLQEEGIHFNIEEANIIRDLIENKNKTAVITVLEQKYKALEEELKKEKISSQKVIEELRKQNEKLSKLDFLSQEEDIVLQESIKTLIKNYNLQLGKKEQEIDYLRRTAEEAEIILKETSHTCQSEVNTISSIKNLLLSDSSITQDQSLHFVYIVNRLIRHLKLYEYNLVRQKEQRLRATKKLSQLNLYIGKSIEKSEKRAEKLQHQNSRFKKQNQQLSSELRKLHAKFNSFKQRIASSEKQTNNVVQLQKDMLETQNKKLNEKYKKIKKYAEDLQQKIVDQFISLGSTPCQHFCSIISNKQKHLKEEFDDNQSLMSQIKPDQVQAFMFGQNQSSKLRVSKISLASSVISYTNKMTKILPKAMLAPLPPIPGAVTPLPISLTLDKLLLKRMCWTSEMKIRFILKLIDLCIELVKVNRKLFNLKPCQMLVSGFHGEIQIVIRRQYSCVSEEQDEANLLYRAPEVLLGFTESEASYVWTVGVIIDQIYHQKPFFKKLNDILSRKENYEVRDSNIHLKSLLQSILRKKQKQRPSLLKVKQQILLLRANK